MSDKRRTIEQYFLNLRMDPKHHLGLGDIRLTLGQQYEILEMAERELARLREESTVLNSLDWNRLREGDRRALNPENQPLFDQFYFFQQLAKLHGISPDLEAEIVRAMKSKP